MINRVLLRIKIIQILYAYYKGEGKTPQMVEKELFYSVKKTYDLYYHLLNLAVVITDYALTRIESRKNKLRPTRDDLNPNTRFIDNIFIAQLRSNLHLKDHLKKEKLSWVNDTDIVKALYEQIIASDFYQEYMEAGETDYVSDKDLWKKIFKKVILASEEFDNNIEDQSIFWTDDVELVVSFVIKTIKKFEYDNGVSQPLLPMFKDDEDADFARRLLNGSIKNSASYKEIIDKHTRNWELERIAFMDTLIMEVAITELLEFPTIPVSVTLNEYIEIAKTYSTEKSGLFINGVLDNIVNQFKQENKLVKVVMINR
jgi:transcription antitermination protein NusB